MSLHPSPDPLFSGRYADRDVLPVTPVCQAALAGGIRDQGGEVAILVWMKPLVT